MKTRKITSVIAGTVLAAAMGMASADEPMELTSAEMDNVTGGAGVALGLGSATAVGGGFINYAATATSAFATPFFASATSASVAVAAP